MPHHKLQAPGIAIAPQGQPPPILPLSSDQGM